MDWRPRKQRKINAEINVVPYIEVMTVLLVIFMLTSPMLTQGVDVNLPQVGSDAVETDDEEPLVITVDREGQYYINVGGDDRVPISREEVASRVGKVLASAPQKLLLVRGDRDASYDKVIQLMGMLQQVGATSVGLVTE